MLQQILEKKEGKEGERDKNGRGGEKDTKFIRRRDEFAGESETY